MRLRAMVALTIMPVNPIPPIVAQYNSPFRSDEQMTISPSPVTMCISSTWAEKLPSQWWFLPCMSAAMAPPTVISRVPGETGRKKPSGTIRSSSSSNNMPAPQFTGEKAAAPTEVKRAPREKAPPPASAKAAEPKPATANERRFLRPGMTECEVIARVGTPEVTSRSGKPATTRWTYLPADGDNETITVVTFANGVVADVVRKLVK